MSNCRNGAERAAEHARQRELGEAFARHVEARLDLSVRDELRAAFGQEAVSATTPAADTEAALNPNHH